MSDANTCTPTLADFLDVLFEPDDLIELRPLRHASKHHPDQQWLTPAELAELDVAEINREASVYFGVNPRPKRGDSKNADIKTCRSLVADFDGGITPEQAAARIELAALPHPSAIVASGGGTHCYWRLTEPTDPATWRATQKGIVEVLDCDNIHDPARVMRMPGTVNRKPERNAALCELVEVNNTRPPLDDFPQVEEPKREPLPAPPPTPSNAADRCRKYLEKLPDAISGQDGHGRTLQAACECFRFGLGDTDAASMLAWFNAEKCSPPWTQRELDHKLESARQKVNADGEVGIRLAKKQDNKPKPKHSGNTTLCQKQPYDTAEHFINKNYNGNTLLHHRGDFYAYDGTAYKSASDDRIRSEVYPFVRPHFDPKRADVANILDALKAHAYTSEHVEPPAWLCDAEGKPPAQTLLPMDNGLLHLPTRELLPHDSQLFTLNALTFDYDPLATCNAWLDFLDSIWSEDEEQIATLQEWVGYLISGLTNQQKIALIVGPKRSGKGTIARILAELIGQANCCNPTLASLSQNFGMQPIIGKMSAVISDARLGGRSDQHAIAERLLNTSGEDSQTIDRKHREPWTGKLAARFTLMSNELPRLADASGALAGRFIIMTMSHSFYGKEDTGLTNRLLAELPGIFNWALEGLDRLTERGYFIQPASSADALQELQDLSSPISAFIRERITIGTEGESPTCDDVYREWKEWCEEEGRHHGNRTSFGRDLKTAIPKIQTHRPASGFNDRPRCYANIRLKG